MIVETIPRQLKKYKAQHGPDLINHQELLPMGHM
jgi:hypothetical protein